MNDSLNPHDHIDRILLRINSVLARCAREMGDIQDITARTLQGHVLMLAAESEGIMRTVDGMLRDHGFDGSGSIINRLALVLKWNADLRAARRVSRDQVSQRITSIIESYGITAGQVDGFALMVADLAGCLTETQPLPDVADRAVSNADLAESSATLDDVLALGDQSTHCEPVPEDARSPRRFPVGSPEPSTEVWRVRSEVNQVVFFRETGGYWCATADSGGDEGLYHWESLNGEHAPGGGMPLVEVLD